MSIGAHVFLSLVGGFAAGGAGSLLVAGFGSGGAATDVDSGVVGADASDAIGDLRERFADLRRELASAQPSVQAAREVDVEALVRRLVAEAKAAPLPSEKAAEAKASPAALAGMQPAKIAEALLTAGLDSEEARELWKELEGQDRLDEVLDRFRASAEAEPTSATKSFELARAVHAAAMARPNHSGGTWWYESDEAYDRTLELDPDLHEARYRKANNLTFWPASFGRMPEAIRHFEMLTGKELPQAQAGRQRAAFLKLGNIYAQQGDEARASRIWQRGLARYPADESLKKRLASVQR